MLPLLAVLFSGPAAMAATVAGAASVPVIIHLLNRKRFRIVNWAAMRFLLAAQKKNAKKLRIEQILLLIVRALILVLIAVAMASAMGWGDRFWSKTLPESFAQSTPAGRRTHRILVIDGSFSMAARSGNTTAFERARSIAQGIVQQSSSGDGLSVLLMTGTTRPVVNDVSDDKDLVAKRLTELQLPHGNSDLEGAIDRLAKLLEQSPAKYRQKEVYFLTDLQQSTWNFGPASHLKGRLELINSKARTVLIDVGQELRGNVAITQLGLQDGEVVALAGRSTRINVKVRAFGAETPDQIKVSLHRGMAQEQRDREKLRLIQIGEKILKDPQRAETTVNFSVTFPKSGIYVLEARLQGDALAVDDVRRIVLDVRDKVKIMLVDGNPNQKNRYEQAAEYVFDALDPFMGREAARPANQPPFQIDVKTASEFIDEGKGDLSDVDCVFLCDVPFFKGHQIQRLEAHVKERGGAVFFLGPQVQAASYEKLFDQGNGLLPASLEGQATPPTGYAFNFVEESRAFDEPPLQAFTKDSEKAGLLEVPFYRIHTVKPIQPTATLYESPRTILSFLAKREDPKVGLVPSDKLPKYPAMVAWQPVLPQKGEEDVERIRLQQKQRGWVFLIPTTANRQWNHWPSRPNYPWVVQEVLRQALSRRLREQTYQVGQVLETYLRGEGQKDVQILVPGKEKQPELTKTTSEGNFALLSWPTTDLSGVYRARVGNSKTVHLYAVNPPISTLDEVRTESDPHRVSLDELRRELYKGWDLQVVHQPSEARHKNPDNADGGSAGKSKSGLGRAIAHWLLVLAALLILCEVILAYVLGHYSAVHERDVGGASVVQAKYLRWVRIGVIASLCFLLLFVAAAGFVLIHEQVTGAFLGFLPVEARGAVERWLEVPAAPAGESPHWDLDYSPYLKDRDHDVWIAGALGLVAAVVVIMVYARERRVGSQAGAVVTAEGSDVAAKPKSSQPFWYFLMFCALRLTLIVLMLAVLLPQMQLMFKRKSWPDLVILIDDSHSMSHVDSYQKSDPKVQRFADELAALSLPSQEEQEIRAKLADAKSPAERQALQARLTRLTEPQRLRVAQALLASDKADWILRLLQEKRIKVHVYHCSGRARRIKSVMSEEDVADAKQAVAQLRAGRSNKVSRLGISLRQVISDFEGHSLAAVVMLTDGVNNEGESLSEVSKFAKGKRVPLYFVGLGSSHEQKDIELSELEVAPTVIVHDTLVLDLKLKARGYGSAVGTHKVTVHLYELDKDGNKSPVPLASKDVAVDRSGAAVPVRLEHRPTTPGIKRYVIEAPGPDDEIKKNNNRLGPREVNVVKERKYRVLYVEGYGRWEYRYLKTLLERESRDAQRKRSIELSAVLIQSDPNYALQERYVLSALPTKQQLKKFDVVILGDVCPDPALGVNELDHVRARLRQVPEFLQNLADLVKIDGKGLLMISGERYAPHTYKSTPLADVLPIDVLHDRSPNVPEDELQVGFKPELTPMGARHPIFSFDERNNGRIWADLPNLYWYASGYKPKPGARVLAVHPTKKAEGVTFQEKHPVVLNQLVGAGRCMFLGIHETWLWRFREHEKRHHQFWTQTIRYLARSKQQRIKLSVDKDRPYTLGEAIKVTAEFPDDVSPPDVATANVTVSLQRRFGEERESRTLQLTWAKDSRATFETNIERTPAGKYVFELTRPGGERPRPRAECEVEPPPSEMDPGQLRMDAEKMGQAATETGGKFYRLNEAAQLIANLPEGKRRTLNATGDPYKMWNHPLVYLVILLLLTTEWILRKRRHLL